MDVCCSVSERYDGKAAFSTITRRETGCRSEAGSYLFTAVKVLFKLIKYFQPKHLSMGSVIILTEHIYLLFLHQQPSVGGLMTNENTELFTRIVNYQAISLCHVLITQSDW